VRLPTSRQQVAIGRFCKWREKLKTVDELYQLLRSDQINWWMLALEIAVVILFVIELMNSSMH